jgi:hypothetical protein
MATESTESVGQIITLSREEAAELIAYLATSLANCALRGLQHRVPSISIYPAGGYPTKRIIFDIESK